MPLARFKPDDCVTEREGLRRSGRVLEIEKNGKVVIDIGFGIELIAALPKELRFATRDEIEAMLEF